MASPGFQPPQRETVSGELDDDNGEPNENATNETLEMAPEVYKGISAKWHRRGPFKATKIIVMEQTPSTTPVERHCQTRSHGRGGAPIMCSEITCSRRGDYSYELARFWRSVRALLSVEARTVSTSHATRRRYSFNKILKQKGDPQPEPHEIVHGSQTLA
jgi:hypothetical protein